MVRAFLISFVTRQVLYSRQEAAAKYPNSWLGWEPGAWVAPQQGKFMTLVPSSSGPDRPAQGDALCFELAPTTVGVRVGRSPECEIVINDATVSRSHLVLVQEPDGSWVANVSVNSRGATVEGKPVPPGGRSPLTRGLQVQLGDAVLTFYDSEGFLARAEKEAELASGPRAGRKP